MDIKKLQRVVVDALEDVKAQNIKVFNTMGLSDMFDRVVLASGTSNRQTRALAYRVAQQVKEAGGHVVSVEGADTGEWVLVDLGDLVVHVMQPAIREYYSLEEIWGGKPVRVKTTDTGARRIVAHGSGDDEPAPHQSANGTHGSVSAGVQMNGADTEPRATTFAHAPSEAPAPAPAPAAARRSTKTTVVKAGVRATPAKAAGKSASAKSAAKTASAKSAGARAVGKTAGKSAKTTARKSAAGKPAEKPAPNGTPRKTASDKRAGKPASARPASKSASSKRPVSKAARRTTNSGATRATPRTTAGATRGKSAGKSAPRKSTATRRPAQTTAKTRSPARKAGVGAARKVRRS
jgi:ribosome-associated protein